MWKKLPYCDTLFISFIKGNSYIIYITDYIKIWWVHYKENEFLNVLKKSNDDLEMENDEEFLKLGLKMLQHVENLKRLHYKVEDQALSVSMTMSCGYPVYLDIQLTEGSKEMFFRNITQQLLKTLHDLKTSESELRSSLIKKDKEIEEYKSETDLRLAMYLKTGVFRDEEHMGKHPEYEKHFGSSTISSCLLERNIDETEDQVVLKQENLVDTAKVKIEPESQDIKIEPESVPPTETQTLLRSETVKREIKNKPHNVSPKKKVKKLLKI